MSLNLATQANTSDRIQNALYAFTRSQILFSAIDLDIFTCIARGNDTVETIQQATGLSNRGLRMLLNGLVGVGFLLRRKDETYTLPPDVTKFLVKGTDEYIGGMVHHCKRLYDNWGFLTDAVRSGQPTGGAQSLAQMEAYFAELVKGLYVSNYPTAQRLASLLEIGTRYQNIRVLDVAGGSAVWSIAALEHDQGSKATVLDFPSVLHVAEEYVTLHGLQERFDYMPGDLEALELPAESFELAILANICHALGPVATQKIFRNLYNALSPGGRLAIVDFVPDPIRSQPGWPLTFGVNMLITTPEGDVFTGEEYSGWLNNAGFQSITIQEIDTEVTAIIAIK